MPIRGVIANPQSVERKGGIGRESSEEDYRRSLAREPDQRQAVRLGPHAAPEYANIRWMESGAEAIRPADPRHFARAPEILRSGLAAERR